MSWTSERNKSWMSPEAVTTTGSLVSKLSPLVKGGLGKTVHTLMSDRKEEDYQLVKSVYKVHSAPYSAKKRLSADGLDGDQSDGDNILETDLNHGQSRPRTFSMESQGSVEEELSMLRRKVEDQEQSLESLRLTMVSVREESTCQKEGVDRVQKKFRSHSSMMERTLRQTQMALQEQQTMLCQQELLVQKLERERKEGSNVFLESVYILMGMYIIQTPLAKYTIQLISMHMDRKGRHQRWLPRFMQIVFFMHFVKLCKALDSYIGFTSRIWSAFSWTGEAMRNLASKLIRFKNYSLTYDSMAYRDWGTTHELSTKGLNLLGEQRVIEKSRDLSPSKSLDYC